MPHDATQFVHRLLSGESRGLAPDMLRGALRCVEPVYAGVMRLRNRLYASGVLRAHRLDRPVISIGNITAGGTGKTPMVRWLAGELARAGHRPAILMRGYKGRDGLSDEQTLLAEALGDSAIVHADPDRVAGGRAVLARDPSVDVLVLDDGFQHRRLHRDFDLVLIDATNPFGYGHVHPRGLLREPLSGLGRADAVVITRADQAPGDALSDIERTIRKYNRPVPIYRARHAHAGLRSAAALASAEADLPLTWLTGRKFFAVAGIANPHSLHCQLLSLPGQYAGSLWFGDHHEYSEEDLRAVHAKAGECGAEVVLVTEKDWVKLARLRGAQGSGLAVVRLDLRLELLGEDAKSLLGVVQSQIPNLKSTV